jgi:hypothetical protein
MIIRWLILFGMYSLLNKRYDCITLAKFKYPKEKSFKSTNESLYTLIYSEVLKCFFLVHIFKNGWNIFKSLLLWNNKKDFKLFFIIVNELIRILDL